MRFPTLRSNYTSTGNSFLQRAKLLIRRWLISVPLLSFALTLIIVRVASAHPADMYFHTVSVSLSPDGVRIIWELIPGPMLGQKIWSDADQDQDEIVSTDEAKDWTQTVIQNFSADFDREPLALKFQAVEWPSDISGLFTGNEKIRIHFQASWPKDISHVHQLTIENQYDPQNSANWFNVDGENGIVFAVPEQKGGMLRVRFESTIEDGDTDHLASWESGRPTLPWIVESLGLGAIAENATTQSPNRLGFSSILEGLVTNQQTSPLFILGAVVIAILLGAMHALGPGHGKTIVAAYLVGSQGKFYHAVALGAMVTLTHTGSVFALGMLALTASRYFAVAEVFPFLELVSGLLILFLGFGLLYPRLRYRREYLLNQHQIKNRQPAMWQNASGGGMRLTINQPIEEIGPPHSHDPSEFGYIPKGPLQGNPLAQIRWRSLVVLGVSGGLIPCPDAIAILLIAVTINRIAYGLSLIVAFSIGLALVLIFIGILIVQGKRLFNRLQWLDKMAYVVPVLSALVVFGMGAFLTVSAIRNISGSLLEVESTPTIADSSQFDMQHASVIYTALDERDLNQLFIVPATGGQAKQITEMKKGIVDYSVSQNLSKVIYATPDESSGTQLWQLTPSISAHKLLLDCPDASCSNIVWSPDERGVLYSRQEIDTETNISGIPSIWWLDLTTLETTPLFQDAQMPGFNPRWSPDGKWLSYTSFNPPEMQIYHIESGESRSIPTQTRSPAIWSPGGDALLLTDIEPVGDPFIFKVYRYDLTDQQLSALDVDQTIDENYPSWSPDGQWIAVVRREWKTDVSVRENQIWLMQPDGSEAHIVTQDHGIFHNLPIWSPDGHFLLYDVISASTSNPSSGIHILDVETREVSELAAPGNRPSWLLLNQQETSDAIDYLKNEK